MTTTSSLPGLAPEPLAPAAPQGLLNTPSGKLLRLKLIGQMEAWTLGSENVLPLGRKTRALLAILAMAAPRPITRARLAELLWSRRPEEPARASLRQEVHRLMEALQSVHADILIPTRDRLALNADLVWVDVECLLLASIAEPAGLTLLNGEVLEGFDGLDPAFDTWLAVERERIHDRACSVAEAILRERVEPDEVIGAAKQLLALDKAHEGAWRALMLAYTERGERGLAVQAYDQCRAALSDLLSATPSPETQRLIAEIRGGSAPGRALADATTLAIDTPRLGRVVGAKLGVLPLRARAAGPAIAQLCHELADEITVALARFRWLAMVSASSLAQLGNREEPALRQTFGLDFLLDGSIQQGGDTIRVSLQLLDLRENRRLVWAERLEHPANALPTLAYGMAANIAAQLDAEILLIEARRAAANAISESSALELTLRAIPLIARLQRQDFEQAGWLLSQAIALDADFAAAHAWRGYWLAFAVGQGWTDDIDASLLAAGQHAERALALDPQDARSLAIIGHVRAYAHQQPREALKFHERALVLNPNLAMAWGLAALTYTYLGDLEEASHRFEHCRQLCPVDTNAFFFDTGRALLALNKRDYPTAIQLGRASSELNPGFSAGLKHYLAALGHGRCEKQAGEVLQRLLAIEPQFSIERFISRCPFDRPADRDHYAEGLRLAGVREACSAAPSAQNTRS